MDPLEIKNMIESGVNVQHVEVKGDGSHFEAVIVSEEFDGKSLVQRHQIVYKALGDSMREDIHALSMKTYTPEQWARIS
jgi:acid stress-induced BolA-like protein IbaG/YrbA